jgi:hypothetical protein
MEPKVSPTTRTAICQFRRLMCLLT